MRGSPVWWPVWLRWACFPGSNNGLKTGIWDIYILAASQSISVLVQGHFGIVSRSHYCAELHTRLFLPTNLFHNAKILESSKREPCRDCGKMFKSSILQSHQRNHTKRSNFKRKVQPSTLVPSQKSFGSWLHTGWNPAWGGCPIFF